MYCSVDIVNLEVGEIIKKEEFDKLPKEESNFR